MKNKTIIRPLGVAFLALALFATSACDTLLEVENPGDVTEEGLAGEQALPVLVNSTLGSLIDAYEDIVLGTGIFTDELAHSGSFTNFRRMDRRQAVDNDFLSGNAAPWQELHTTIFLADLAEQRIREADASDALLAEALAYGAFARLFLAELFCEVTISGGPLQSPDAVMQEAEAMFGESIQTAQAAGSADILNLARTGRARARLWLGDDAGAAADAGAVPEDFLFEAVYNQSANANAVAIFTTERRETSISEEFWNLEEVPQCAQLVDDDGNPNPLADPDVVSQCPFGIEGFVGPDNETPLFVQLLYPTRDSEMPLASGTMAMWYEREALGTADPFEMAVDLFLTGNRLGQMRRNNDPFLQGGQSCFIMPEREEDTNPNL